MSGPTLRWRGPQLSAPPAGYMRSPRAALPERALPTVRRGELVPAERGPGPEPADGPPLRSTLTSWPGVGLLAGIVLAAGFGATLFVPIDPSSGGAGLGVVGGTAAWAAVGMLVGILAIPGLLRAGGRLGADRLLVLVLLLDATAGFGVAIERSLPIWIFWRAAQGIGLASLPLALAMVRGALPPALAAPASRAIGLAFAGGVAGGAVGALAIAALGAPPVIALDVAASGLLLLLLLFALPPAGRGTARVVAVGDGRPAVR